MKSKILPLALSLFSSLGFANTTVTITDKVLVADTEPLGIHFNGDNFYDSVILKQRVAENFEGGVIRLHVIGPAEQPDPSGFVDYAWNAQQSYDESWIGATAHILCGPQIWETRTIVGIDIVPNAAHNRGRDALKYRFDKPVTWGTGGRQVGILLENTDLTRGTHPWMDRQNRTVDGQRRQVLAINEQYTTPDTAIAGGDTPPGVGQQIALRMDGSAQMSRFISRAQFYNAGPFDGEWTVRVWLKALDGTSPVVAVGPTLGTTFQANLATEIRPTPEWKEYTLTFDITKPAGEENPVLCIEVQNRGGIVLMDNLQAMPSAYLRSTDNPTPFRDELVNTFKFLNPGSVRYLRNTKDTLHNWILPRIENAAKDGRGNQGTDEFGTHEFYQFCQFIGADPWANLPGTMLLEEMDLLMEYHAGPAGTKGGDLRIRLGQEKPWTEVFDTIHLQFGNEVITFGGTGFYGPDYWSALIDRIKKSPYYEEGKYVFHLNEQGSGIAGMDVHPAFDRFTINGYHIYALYDDQIERAADLPGFYDFVYANAWHLWMDERHNKFASSLRKAKEVGDEISIYEGLNYHTTFSDDKPPMQQINRMLAGFAGGVSSFNNGLILLKHHGARVQQNFNLAQGFFSPGGSFGNLPERIRGWGGVLRLGNENERRYRPRFLAHHIGNQVIGGDLVETVHSGDDPHFEVTNRFGSGYGPSRDPREMTIANIPRIHSYAFREGKRRGLILVSNDPRGAQPITLNFDGGVQDGQAQVWWLHSENLEDTNEHDWEPESPAVTVKNQTIPFASGHSLQLPAATIMAFEWTEE